MKTCPKCGELNSDSLKLCENCGAMLESKMTSKNNQNTERVEDTDSERIIKRIADLENIQGYILSSVTTIEKCAVFFAVLAIINLIAAVVFGIKIMKIIY